jgi:hypothetical protein
MAIREKIMKRSDRRILTTHTGSLPRPALSLILRAWALPRFKGAKLSRQYLEPKLPTQGMRMNLACACADGGQP